MVKNKVTVLIRTADGYEFDSSVQVVDKPLSSKDFNILKKKVSKKYKEASSQDDIIYFTIRMWLGKEKSNWKINGDNLDELLAKLDTIAEEGGFIE